MSAFCFFRFMTGFSELPKVDAMGAEQYDRLVSVFAKNKMGYHTRFMSDFELFLEAMLNERFIDESTLYYDDAMTSLEVEDVEAGLAGESTQADVRHLNRDRDTSSHDSYVASYLPGRVGTNYASSDALSCYKILPRGQKPSV
jgi:hypothetical protein